MQVTDLVVEYRRGPETIRPIDGLTLDVASGQLVLLLGPSGSGKTTLLSCLAGILTPTSGTIVVLDRTVTALGAEAMVDYRRNGVGVVFQGFNLVPSLTAVENVAVPLWSAGVRRKVARTRAVTLLERLGLGERLHHRPDQLSGGQQQRVAIARALVADPPVLLADEPTAHLDPVQAKEVLRILRELADEGRTVMVSTHDARLLPLADDAVTLTASGPTLAAGQDRKRRRLAGGKVLFRQGDEADVVYVVVKGGVRLEREHDDGTKKVVAEYGPGDYFGELGPLLSFPRGATATAIGPTTVEQLSVAAFRIRYGPKVGAAGAAGAAGAVGPAANGVKLPS